MRGAMVQVILTAQGKVGPLEVLLVIAEDGGCLATCTALCKEATLHQHTHQKVPGSIMRVITYRCCFWIEL